MRRMEEDHSTAVHELMDDVTREKVRGMSSAFLRDLSFSCPRAVSCHVMSHVMSCHVMSCHVMSLSCRAMPRRAVP
jgi:hypothetical protein